MATTQLPSLFGGDHVTEAETEWHRVLEALRDLIPIELWLEVDLAHNTMVTQGYDSGVMGGLGRFEVDPSMSLDLVIDACRESLVAVTKVLIRVTA